LVGDKLENAVKECETNLEGWIGYDLHDYEGGRKVNLQG